ncbi:hypothetical protein [Prevotella sp. KH2C16]|uniref:hypothetical protein n=1 Tax=Prevotella sp. KH2C16 TaxID=1855325 RepID=UPI0008ED4CF3|nr:hypothetical protein [Prevotella sp. KH2C16]SFG24650.1 hypothetical protein SAMN05216383_1085 [Prevotella sp. KH2C16]
MKRLLLLIALLASLQCRAQSQLVNQQEDSLVNLVAWFCKGDSMRYAVESVSYKVDGKDTTVQSHVEEDILLTVLDSTSKGYRIELTSMPRKATLGDSKGFLKGGDAHEWFATLFHPAKVIFTTSDVGEVQNIENWREIRDDFHKKMKPLLDSIYANTPGMQDIVPRKNLESLLLLTTSTEENIRKGLKVLSLLFDMHGRQYKLGNTPIDGLNGYNSKGSLTAGYGAYEKEDGWDDDIRLFSTIQTVLTLEDLKPLVGATVGMLTKEDIGQEVEKALHENMKENLTVTDESEFYYFFNGWPCSMTQSRIAGYPGYQKVKATNATWTYRAWKASAQEPEDSRQSL